MTNAVKFAIALALFVWASAFVGIAQGLESYSPESLALLRFVFASAAVAICYYFLPQKNRINIKDASLMIISGMFGVGLYSLCLNNGELKVDPGIASFIISQSPIVTAILAAIFLRERITPLCTLGFLVSFVGVAIIAYGLQSDFSWNINLNYIFIATIASGFYTFTQRPFVKKYHALEVTAYYIWGGALFLTFYLPNLISEFPHASFIGTFIAAYLGVVPALVGLLAWSYVLSHLEAARAGSFLYFMPFLTTLLGWLYLHEVPPMLSIIGGLIAIVGVWVVNHSYKDMVVANLKDVEVEV